MWRLKRLITAILFVGLGLAIAGASALLAMQIVARFVSPMGVGWLVEMVVFLLLSGGFIGIVWRIVLRVVRPKDQ